jgi:NAD(P)-dependent dehydrogenase (short-subunit alcohol dehydrogenase family)
VERLDGRVAVVTGAAAGIGRALAESLIAEGASVVLADVAGDDVARVAEEIGGVGVQCDVRDPESVQALADAAVAQFGAVHILCNNAGVSGRFGRTWATPAEEWRWVFDVNVLGVVNGLRSFVPILLAQDEGHIVNTASAAAFEALPGMGPYAASKHAVLGLSEALRREIAPHVGVSVLVPGGVVRSSIMSADHVVDGLPAGDDDALPSMIRTGFTHAIANGNDPALCARAAIGGIRTNAYLVCDEPEQLAEWSAHHVAQGTGTAPTWP